MKILHKYEDGTLKVVLDNGEITLISPIQDIEIKILVKKGDTLISVPIAGGLPTEIKCESDAEWMKLSATTDKMELIYKAMGNAGLIVARALENNKITYDLLSRLSDIREILFGKKESKK